MIKLYFYEKVKTFKENTEAQQPFFKVEIISKRCVEIVVDPKIRCNVKMVQNHKR